MNPECSSYLHGLNKITTVQLNVQYPMVLYIEKFGKVVSYRTVLMRILPLERVQLYPERVKDASMILYTGTFGDMGFHEVTPHMFLIDPYF